MSLSIKGMAPKSRMKKREEKDATAASVPIQPLKVETADQREKDEMMSPA